MLFYAPLETSLGAIGTVRSSTRSGESSVRAIGPKAACFAGAIGPSVRHEASIGLIGRATWSSVRSKALVGRYRPPSWSCPMLCYWRVMAVPVLATRAPSVVP